MNRLLRGAGLALLLSGTLAADVLVLKDGKKVGGKIAEKSDRYEVTTDVGLRSFLKDEVEKVVTSPKELVGDVDRLFEEAKQEYQAALQISEPAEQTAKLKETLGKVKGIRETLSSARELFPEDKYSELDQKLVQVMQLMRLLRERSTTDLAKGREKRGIANADPSVPPAAAPARSTEALQSAFSALLDPARRADALARAAAREAFRTQREHFPEVYDLATAAMIFLSRSDADWRLAGAVAKALQDYFAQPWLKEPLKFTPALHQQTAAWLLDRIASVRKAEPAAAVDALILFGAGHFANAPFGSESEKTARSLGLVVRNGIAGTAEGYALRELDTWISNGDFDLAVLTWVKEYRDTDTPAVRYVWAYALLRVAQAKKKGFNRPIEALETVKASDAPTQAHLAALEKSIKLEASCSSCGGEGKFRCPNCCGKKQIRFDCSYCKGKGKVPIPGRGGRAYEINCTHCHGLGYEKLIVCEKCKEGFITCAQCGGKSPKPPELEEICTLTECPDCGGRGLSFRTVLWACRSCMGLGQKIVPKADPSKILP